MRIIIIGASGTIGSEVCRHALDAGHEVIATGCNHVPDGYVKLDIENQDLSHVVPDLGSNDSVILLSAHTSPGWVAQHIERAQSLNVDASLRVVETSYAAGARILMLSTDQVFDGELGPYDEESPTNPKNTYGAMKVVLENRICGLGDRGCVARTGWNASWTKDGNCIVKETYKTLLYGQAKMASDNLITISAADETADGLVRLASGSKHNLYHLVGSPIIRSDLADMIIETSIFGEQMAYSPILFNELSYQEGRPLRPWMLNQRATAELGLTFSSPMEIVERKVKLLDKWHEQRTAK